LTKDEYLYTIADRLGVVLTEGQRAQIPEELSVEDLTNQATSQTVLGQHALGYALLAKLVADQLDLPAFLLAHGGCSDPSPECFGSFFRAAALSLFRRPATDDELQDFSQIRSAGVAAGWTVEQIAQATLEAMLQAPQFLYRLERERGDVPSVRAATSFEVASRLSYLVWSSAPDDELLGAAQADSLVDPVEMREQLNRLLANVERSRRPTARFVTDWLGLSGVAAEAAPLTATAIALYQDELWLQDTPLFDLLASTRTYLPAEVGAQLGLTAVATLPTHSTFDTAGHPGMVGLLTHPAVIQAMARSGAPSMVKRGLFLKRQLFCQTDIPDPPETLRTEIDAFSANLPADASERDGAELRLGAAGCAVCHSLFEPLAFAFEPFDAGGLYQQVGDNGKAARSDGVLAAGVSGAQQDTPFQTVGEFVAALRQSPAVQHCVIQKHLQWAIGRPLEPQEEPALADLAAAFARGNGTYHELMDGIVTHAAFRELRVE
jgi:hypothetical protein